MCFGERVVPTLNLFSHPLDPPSVRIAGKRAVVTCEDNVVRWVEFPEWPWWDMEKVAMDSLYESQQNLSFHQPPGRDGCVYDTEP